jgi:hypothetical protein
MFAAYGADSFVQCDPLGFVVGCHRVVLLRVSGGPAGIWLRAGGRIGELVRELETNERARTDLDDVAVAQTKTQAVEDAGLNVRTAQRFQELAGGRDAQGQAAGRAAAGDDGGAARRVVLRFL